MNLFNAINTGYLKTVEAITRGLSGDKHSGTRQGGNSLGRLFNFSQSYTTGYQQQQALEAVRHYRGWVYVAVRAIAEKIAMYKPTVARVTYRNPNQQSIHSKSWRERTKSMTTLGEDEDLEPVEHDHPLVQLLNDPNIPDVTFSLWYKTIMYGELCGKSLWWLPHNNAGYPVEIWNIPTHWARPEPGRGEDEPLVKGYWIRPMEGVAANTYIDAKDMIDWTMPSPVSYYDGYGPLSGGSAWVDTGEAMAASQWHQMKNMHNPGIVLSMEKGMPFPDPAQLNQAYAMLNQRLQGEGKNRMPLILPPGWQNGGKFGPTNEELDFNESDDRIRDKVLSLFKVPKGVVGIDPTNDTSAYAPNAIFYDQCINPKLHFLGQVLTEKLASRFGDEYRIYWQNCAPHDPVLEHQKMNDALDRCAIVVNEYRQHLDLAPVEWGDVPMQRAGVTPIMKDGTPERPLLADEDIAAMVNQDKPKEKEPEEPETQPVSKKLSMRNRLKKALVPDDAIKFTLPDVRQETSSSCGAACTEAICRAYGVGECDEEWYRSQLGTNEEIGTDDTAIRKLFDSLGLSTTISMPCSNEALRAFLDAHQPVLMLVQAYGNSTEYSEPESDSGHYVVAIGYTADDLIVEDPALPETRGYIPWDELESRWHIPELERWAMAIHKTEVMQYVRSLKFSTNGKH